MRRPSIPFAVSLGLASALAGPRAGAQTPAAPSALEAAAPEYPPPSTRWKTVGVGLAATGIFYGVGAGLSYVYPDASGMKDLRIPVAGPWLAIRDNGCASDDTSCTKLLEVARVVLYTLSGAAQAGSLFVAIEGLFMPTEEPRPDVKPAPSTPSPSTPSPGGSDKNLFFVPTPIIVGNGGVGLGVVGRF